MDSCVYLCTCKLENCTKRFCIGFCLIIGHFFHLDQVDFVANNCNCYDSYLNIANMNLNYQVPFLWVHRFSFEGTQKTHDLWCRRLLWRCGRLCSTLGPVIYIFPILLCPRSTNFKNPWISNLVFNVPSIISKNLRHKSCPQCRVWGLLKIFINKP